MHICQIKTKLLIKLWKWAAGYWAIFMTASSLFLVLATTLLPFSFDIQNSFSFSGFFYRFFNQSIVLDDLTSNIILFLPLGFGLASILQSKLLISVRATLIISLIASGSLSLSVEAMQAFLPLRSPSVPDLLANSLGGILGATIYCYRQVYCSVGLSTWIYLEKHLLTGYRLIFLALGYTVFIIYLMTTFYRANNLSNWDSSFPLVIGNELTGNRPWNGTISQLSIANHSLSEQEISQVLSEKQLNKSVDFWETAYKLIGSGDFHDQNERSPNLVWHGRPPKVDNKTIISIDQQSWLLTQEPVKRLIQSIQNSSQFSLLITISTDNFQQTGPARIVSCSTDLYHRNLTIGQEDSRLVVRLRTPLSGAGGNNPEFAFPNIFVDTHIHQLLLTFNRATLQLYIDNSQVNHTISTSPEILFFRFLPAVGIRNLQITPTNQFILKGLFYLFVLVVPSIFLLLMIHNKRRLIIESTTNNW